jgi:hypothetical protein
MTMLQKIEGFDVEKFRSLTLRRALIEPVEPGEASIRARGERTDQGRASGPDGSGSDPTSAPAPGGGKRRALALPPRGVSVVDRGNVP